MVSHKGGIIKLEDDTTFKETDAYDLYTINSCVENASTSVVTKKAVNAKFYATGYTNGGANEKQIGPFKTKEEAIKSGREEQGASGTFRFAGVVGEDGTYVYHNSRARNANSSHFGFFIGEQVVIKKDPSKKKYRVKEITETGDIRLEGATPLFDASELDTANYAGPYRSRNYVVQKALNAATALNWNYKNQYQFFCVDPSMKAPCILSGWDYREDAKEDAAELKELNIPFKIVSRRFLEQQGIDPNAESSWKKNRR